MAISRADTLTETKRQIEFFSDFMNDFDRTPFGNQLAKVTNVDAVNQSLRNLIKTNLGERFFQPIIGSNVYASLFENQDSDYLDVLEVFIKNTVENCEPRVKLISVDVSSDLNNENYVNVTIIYYLINNSDPITLNILLKRIR